MSLASRKLIQATAGAAGAADTGDDDFANVVLLLDGDGTSGDDNNTFTDSSTNGFTVTESGSVVQGSFSPYGDNWSVYANGYSTFVTTTDNVPLGSGDFTVEFWFFPTEADFGNAQYGWGGIHFDTRNARTDGAGLVLGTTDTGQARWSVGNSVVLESSSTLTAFEWNHIAYVRDNGVFYTFINGVRDSLTYSNSTNFSRTNLRINGPVDYSSNGYLEPVGNISNLRQSNTVRYSGTTYTVPTNNFTDDTNTKLLMFQANRFVDNSATEATFTIAGTPKVTPFSPFKDDDARDITTDGGSGYFGGSSDYLKITTNIDDIATSEDFNIEAWIYVTDTSVIRGIFQSGEVNDTLGIRITTAERLQLVQTNGGTLEESASGAIKLNQWHHIAVSRSSGTRRLFIDGAIVDSTTSSTASFPCDKAVVGGRWLSGSLGQPFSGYISDARFVVGSAIYTSAFTPPTAPISAVTNTELLYNFQDAGIYDRSGINNLDTVGNAQIDTAVKKYGTGSMEFDGTGDYLKTVENETLELGTGDWTIEFWVYFDAVNNSTVKYMFDWRTSSDTSNSFLAQESNNNWTYYNGAGSSISSGFTSSTFSASTWHHVAISKAGTATKFFVDGTQTASSSDVSTYDSGTLVIGSRYNGQNYLDGYIDDLRITKGIARYTSSFTPPTAAHGKF